MNHINNIPILMYHEISEDIDNDWTITQDLFRKHMFFLKEQGYTPITLNQLNKNLDGKSVILTFDDGRIGFFKHAYPILKELNFKATIFIVTDWIDNKNIPEQEKYSEFMNWDQIIELSNHCTRQGYSQTLVCRGIALRFP